MAEIKKDFNRLGPKLKEVRKELENWRLFYNPYYRLKGIVKRYSEELSDVRPHANTTPFPHNIVSIMAIFTLPFTLVKPFLQETFFDIQFSMENSVNSKNSNHLKKIFHFVEA